MEALTYRKALESHEKALPRQWSRTWRISKPLHPSNSQQVDRSTSKKVRLRVRHILDENTMEEYGRRITDHIGSLSIVQAFINNLVIRSPTHAVLWSSVDEG